MVFKNKRDIWIRFPLGMVLIVLFGLSPILVSMLMSNLTELLTGEPCHEGNCIWGGIGWLFLITLPVALILAVVFLIVSIIDIVKILSNSPKQ